MKRGDCMVLAKRILLISIACLLLIAIAAGILLLLQNNAGAITDKGVFV